MQIRFSPMRRDLRLTLDRSGDTLTINGEAFDFSPLPEGATLPREAMASEWFAGPVERQDGVLHLSLILPHGPNPPLGTLMAEPVILTDDGPVTLPPYDQEIPDAD
ncbi:hypothetical protein ACSSVY_002731 [Roseovarius sp. MBR-51]